MKDFPIDFDGEYYKALGHVLAAFTELEECVFYSLLAMSEGQWVRNAILIERLSFRNRRKALNVIGKTVTKDEDERRELHDIIKHIGYLAEERNKLVHSYHNLPEDGAVHALRMKRSLRVNDLKFQEELISSDDIDELSRDMWQTHQDLIAFVHSMYEQGKIEDPSGNVRQGFYEEK